MGKLADRIKTMGEEKEFIPLELTSHNVNATYRRCKATEKTASDDIAMNYLFSKNAGFESDSGSFYMSISALRKERSTILYLLGQLYDIHHTDEGFIYLKNASLNYHNLPWFQETSVEEAQETIYNLISLGTTALTNSGSPLISNIIKPTARCMAADIMPTFSPKDPKFEEWSQSEKGKALLSDFYKMYEEDKK